MAQIVNLGGIDSMQAYCIETASLDERWAAVQGAME